MDITWLGHSCFRLHDADMVVVTDPYPASVGLRVDGRPASVVTVSNTHPNHDNTASIEGDPKIFRDPGEYEYNGVTDELKPVDVVLVPAGGHCTLDIDQVYQTLQDLDAKVVIPMHYKTDGINLDIDPIDNFVRRMGLDEVQPQPRLVVTSANLGSDMRFVVMTSQGRPR